MRQKTARKRDRSNLPLSCGLGLPDVLFGDFAFETLGLKRELVLPGFGEVAIEAAALMVRRTRFFNASLSSVTLHRLGRKRRFVRRLAWLTLLPVSTALPVSSQRRAIVVILVSKHPGSSERGRRSKRRALRKGGRDIRGPPETVKVVVSGPPNLRIDEFCE